MILEWDHDEAGEAEAPSWAREAATGELRRPMPGQHSPATRRALRAHRTTKALVWVGVVGALALALWAGLWHR